MDPVLQIAKMIDHSLLHPTLTDAELKEGCQLADEYHAASVCVKPYHVAKAAEYLADSDVLVGTVISFPHGNSSLQIKLAETEKAIADGAIEIDMVSNVGKVLSEDWDYVEKEITAITELCHSKGALVKVIFANDFLTDDKYKIKLCEICSRAKADWVKTSTGYNYVKVEGGDYNYKGATDPDLKLMREHSAPEVQVKAAGKVGSLEDFLRIREKYQVTRVGVKNTDEIVNAAKKHFAK